MKKDLIEFPFDKYSDIELTEDILSPVQYNATWLLPQAMAFLGSESFRLTRNSDGKISMEETFKSWVNDVNEGKIQYNGVPITFDWFKGFITVLNRAPRGEILGSKMTQSKPVGARWAASVPLILSAFKEYRNVKYSEWDLDPKFMKYFVDGNLYPLLILYPFECPYTTEQLLEFRDITDNGKALTARTTITKTPDDDFNRLPKYLKTMLCQVWVWHPSVRHSLAITNLQDLDTLAPPLVESKVLHDNMLWDIK